MCFILVSGPQSGKWEQDSGEAVRMLGMLPAAEMPLLLKTHLSYLICFHHP